MPQAPESTQSDLQSDPLAHPSVEQIPFAELHTKERIELSTADGWILVITRYKPIPQAFSQPIFGAPILLVHGFAQNRRAWTSGEFVRNMLFFGADLYVLELRGHGKSSRSLQQRRSREAGTPPPHDLDYDWDIDSYFLYDLPAAVAKVREVSGHDKIFYCGHSMGGMLGYGYAGMHGHELAGLITIGAASDLGKGSLFLQLASRSSLFFPAVDLALAVASTLRLSFWQAYAVARGVLGQESGPRPDAWQWRFIPMDLILRRLERLLTDERYAHLTRVAPYLTVLVNPERTKEADLRWLLKEGSDREPRKVLEQFGRWVRENALICYRTGYDFKRSFDQITLPTAVIFGDRDWLAGIDATRSIYYGARSDYLLWRPVKGNSHIELTMGRDLRQICYDIKNLIEYARAHSQQAPSLPRRDP